MVVTATISIELPPRNLKARREFHGQTVDLHMDNARIQLRRNDSDPNGARGKADLQQYTLDLCGELGDDFGADLASATNPELVSSISAAAGRSVPDAFKVSRLGI